MHLSGHGTIPNGAAPVGAENAQKILVGGGRKGQEGAQGEDDVVETNETELTMPPPPVVIL